MAEKIKFDYIKMATAVEKIQNIATRYESAAVTFNQNFDDALSACEGVTKEKLKRYIDGDVYEYTHKGIPALVNALATMLEGNAKQMENADQQIANSIPAAQGSQGQ